MTSRDDAIDSVVARRYLLRHSSDNEPPVKVAMVVSSPMGIVFSRVDGGTGEWFQDLVVGVHEGVWCEFGVEWRGMWPLDVQRLMGGCCLYYASPKYVRSTPSSGGK